MPSNLCSRSQHLKEKKKFSLRRKKTYGQSFLPIIEFEKILGHALDWPALVSDFSSTKDSNSLFKPRTWKNYAFSWEETLPLRWIKFSHFFRSIEHCRHQTCLLGRLRFSNNCSTRYDVRCAARTLSVQLPIIKKKSYLSDKENNWPFVPPFFEAERRHYFLN